MPTRLRFTTSEGPWFNPDLVGKWSHSPAKALPFLPQAQTNTILILNPSCNPLYVPSISTGLKSETQVKKEKVHSSSSARCGGTWDLDPVNFFLRYFFYWIFFWGGDWSLRTGPPPPLECNSILSLVTVVLITLKGAEPPGSRRIGVIGALVIILPSETV